VTEDNIIMNKQTPKSGATTRQQAAASNVNGRTSIGGSNAQSQLSELNKKVDQLLISHNLLQKSVETLQNVIVKLEDTNKNLLSVNQQLTDENKQLADQLKKTKSTLSTVIDDLESSNQRFHNKTVEIQGVVVGEDQDACDFVIHIGQTVGCTVTAEDIDNVYKKIEYRHQQQPRTKVIVTFNNLRKRMDFYYKSRKFKHNPPKVCEAGLRKLNVVDYLTYFKKTIFLNIIDHRKDHPDIVKNVWINNGDIYIRRFGENMPAEVVKNADYVEAIFQPITGDGFGGDN
jgi:hypothetical protein